MLAITDLILLRHGEVASHRGDVPLTPTGRAQAEQAGRRLAKLTAAHARVLVGPTLRAQQTGLMLVHGWMNAVCDGQVVGPAISAALRNPDLYLAGHRVDMVSSAAAFAEQVPGMTEAQVVAMSFYAGFLASADRVGFWLNHPAPPGDTASAVADRIAQFAASLDDTKCDDLVVGVTQSPVLRAIASYYAGADPGEPPYLYGYRVQPHGAGRLTVSPVDWNLAGAS